MTKNLSSISTDYYFKDVKKFLQNNRNYRIIDLYYHTLDNRIYGNFILYSSIACSSCSATLVCDTYDHTGNFFVETEDYENNCIGWFLECKSDLLMYYFVNTKVLYIINRKLFIEWFNNVNAHFSYISSINNTYGTLVSRDMVECQIDILKFYL